MLWFLTQVSISVDKKTMMNKVKALSVGQKIIRRSEEVAKR